jgi:hypothetical protein
MREEPGACLVLSQLVVAAAVRAKATLGPVPVDTASTCGYGARVAELLGYALPFAAFLAIYAVLRERERRKSGVRPPIQWAWLAAITACAVVAVVGGLFL